MERNIQLRTAWDFVENTGKSIFLTGKAGTGKTTFLKTVVERSRKRSVVVAPTGVAAINAGGVTIHSFFQLPLSPYVPDATIKNRFDFGKDKRRIIASLDLLIIDEISMVRSDLLDAVDNVLRRFRDRFAPFGGVQLLMIGDLQQLTPVVTPEDERLLAPYYDTPYFFGSKALKQVDYVTIQLDKVFRQQDDAFIGILNHIRDGNVTDADLGVLNSRYMPGFIPKDDDGYIRLTTHNKMADQYNENALRRLPSKAFRFKAEVEGTFPEYSYPTNETLEIKVGTQVMFVKNDTSIPQRYYNGRIGKVTYVDQEKILVKCPDDDNHIEVEPHEWENAKYTINPQTREIETEVQGVFRQYPLRLAWAITIHKSQGLTFDKAIIDANFSFAPGQVYVALSRCRTIEGMVLASPLQARAIINDRRVDEYISHQEENTQASIARLPELKEEYFRFLLTELFDFQPILRHQEHMVRIFIEFFSRSHPQLEALHKQTLADFKTKVVDVAGKWTASIRQKPFTALHEETFLDRVKRSATYFADTIKGLFEKPVRLTQGVSSNNKQAMTRLDNVFVELRQAVKAKTILLKHIAEEGFTSTIYLKQKQMALLDAMGGGAQNTSKKNTSGQKKQKEKKPPKEKTWVTSFILFKQGKSVKQIAKERGLTTATIAGHLIKYIPQGLVTLDDLVGKEHQEAIRRVINLVGREEGINAIKSLSPPDVEFWEIKLLLGDYK